MRWQWPRTARAERAVRYTVAGLLAAVPGIWAILTDDARLGLVAAAIVLVAILLGPVIERTWIK
ncbi:MAG: hypothetical protein OER93_04070 [Thermoleophilia bacterium]|nr:hypothetical protein [Thermoleophilia bacterium]